MQRDFTDSDRVIIAASVFSGFGAAHLIDDFLYGVPAEFHLSNELSQFLGLFFFAALTGLIALAARGRRRSYFGLVVIGTLLAAADTTKHLPEMLSSEHYRSGLASTAYAVGLVLSGIATAVVAYAAWLRARRAGG
jgi:hypothetical protein